MAMDPIRRQRIEREIAEHAEQAKTLEHIRASRTETEFAGAMTLLAEHRGAPFVIRLLSDHIKADLKSKILNQMAELEVRGFDPFTGKLTPEGKE